MAATSKLALMIVATAVIVLAPAPAKAQGGAPAASPPHVPINSGTFAKFMKASANFAAYVKKHPEDSTLDNSSYDNEIDAAKAICGPRPALQQVIAAGGLTCLQWITLAGELQKAGSAAAIIKGGEKLPSEFAVPASDIDFYNKHVAEITLALQEISAATGSQ